ncbi:MAG: hypothetical protein COV59_01125 [Candidatus Magasanikbacteria bacterium CG11_big_fil_rev_8_21_14_0_20_39_34]|uniref:Uncharacterized protein n=1 Tax=Candidatus Magasanikbacteria bacterium CG11_big_fil_rev_8_21_14_0_20_39_34 TaxID=1974653 RepID=A0A2H0N6B6_9BACT|nr:MAG: hypothetical protein COV59_01125 [Candidatus Magasanikbacteria bacterium CG11_big_fil_rev_8_21_14_0_20_39_34]
MIDRFQKPSAPLSSIMSTNTIRAKKSLYSIVRDVKKTLPGENLTHKKMIAKTIYKLNNDPHAVVTNRMTKAAVKALGEAGHLKGKWHQNVGAAITHVKHMHEKTSSNTDTSHMSPEERLKNAKTWEEKKAAQKAESIQRRRLEARARQARQEAEDQEKGTKLGLKEWQESTTSIGEAVKQKERERKNQAEQDMSELERQSKQIIDMSID